MTDEGGGDERHASRLFGDRVYVNPVVMGLLRERDKVQKVSAWL